MAQSSCNLSLSLSVTFFLFGYFFFDLMIMLSAIALGCVNAHSRFQDPIFKFFFGDPLMISSNFIHQSMLCFIYFDKFTCFMLLGFH